MTTATTDALVIHATKDLRFDTAPLPEPGPGEVRIAMQWGGICGSDLHYVSHGGVGASILHNPMILGHEVSGIVAATGPGITSFSAGDPVAIHPARPCGTCPECQRDLRHLCRNVRFLGSAANNPHTDGGFRRAMIVNAAQLRHLPPGLDTRRACLAEPLAVALHAISRAGDVTGKTVLVQGAGPIGLLIVAGLVHAGAARVVTTDLQDFPLERARLLGASEVHNARTGQLNEEFDITFEATGVGAALPEAIARTRKGGILVQVGMFPPGDVAVPLAQIIVRELDFRGTLRFDHEFDDALTLLAEKPEIADILVTQEFPITRFQDAFSIAPDRSRAAKVLLALSE
ncbi:L-idonate 5-dehydrogenase [Acetobacter oeni]|uniref:L-idonate 5-dehydrogenase n=1 Tax=Acetobacter oeni TaxID=304077 RepID=A0A511XL13_9PROT|nr:L-idonate 5-dehydrogenase [Acetobacter oeni]MBB3883218.1 L-idonate 5-dehydrogenase [Acetobacter oeni]NHO19284.1 alcohol dehydrogenase catalytic domain-containing protein [Acetobacter oeni]GBR07281.1 zinc-dependent alcohol dehydrogenase [Acetobacter oeni LMG 21952]GEN63633.1 L-idonate 5-dehydrogenase [Acetobacter oeni]